MITITNPKEAIGILKECLAASKVTNRPASKPTSRARWATVQTVSQWYKQAKKQELNTKWFGRALSAAIKEGMAITAVPEKGQRFYRINK